MSQMSDLLSPEVYEEIRGDGNIAMISDFFIGDLEAVSDRSLIDDLVSHEPYYTNECDGPVAACVVPAQAIRQIPANEEYPGEYGFNFKLSNGLSGKKAWEFSQELNKVYIDMDVKLSVEFQWTPPHQWLYVRATPRFSEPQHANEPVQRCITHSNDKHPSNRDCSPGMLPHVIRCHNEGSEYVAVGNELSVRTPLGSPQCGSERVTLLYSFMCKNSCTTGMNRRPIQVVYTLENASGAVLGRRKHDVRICSCPKRDREKDETGSLCRKTTKKRKVDGRAIQKTISRVKEEPSSFEVVSMPELSREDGLPGTVCTSCYRKINDAYSFKRLCEESNHLLLNYFSKRSKDAIAVADESLPERREPVVESDSVDVPDDGGRDFDDEVVEPTSTEVGAPNAADVGRFVCVVCNKSYAKPKNLEAHMGAHSGDEPFACATCGKRFSQSRAYACHMRTHADPDGKRHECAVCGERFAKNGRLLAHMRTHGDAVAAATPSHVCSVCGKSYCNAGNLASHMRLHTGEKPYGCNVCGRRFAQSNAHSYHMKLHSGERPYKCDVCPKAFTTNGQLVNHRRLHTGEKPFGCDVCGKRFTQKVAHTVHAMTHTGDKPHLCNVCGKTYYQSSQLTEHMRTHTGASVQCSVCGKSYTTAGNLAAHMKTHTGCKSHVCAVCDKGFYFANKLAKHMRVHTGERPFACVECPKRFASADVLNVHMRVHTGQRPYRCDECERAFATNSQLRCHARTHDARRPQVVVVAAASAAK